MTAYSGIAAALSPPPIMRSSALEDSFFKSLLAQPAVPILVQVSYDLNVPGQNYRPLIDMLERFGALRIQGSVWLLHWFGNVDGCSDTLHSAMDQTDSLCVTQISGAVRGFESNPVLRAEIQRMLNQARLS